MLRRLAVGLSMVLAALLLLTQVVIPHSRKPQLRIDDEARLARLAKGREIILQACTAAGGLETWQSKRDVSFRLTDTWHVPNRCLPAKKAETMQHYLMHRNAGRIEARTGKGLHQWGLFENKPWALLNGKVDSDGIKNAGYVISNFDYFFSLPFKFLEAGAYPEFVGEEIQDGNVYDKVYVSFGLNVGKYPTDWYLAYFDHATGRLASMIYTSIEKSPSFVEYRASFDGYEEMDGLIMPTRVLIKMSRPISGIKIRDWRIRDVRFDTGLTEAFFKMPPLSSTTISRR
jgi:hypothetical protein